MFKFIIGLIVVVGIKSGLKLIIGESLIAEAIRYGVIVLWVMAVYPFVFSRWLEKIIETEDKK